MMETSVILIGSWSLLRITALSARSLAYYGGIRPSWQTGAGVLANNGIIRKKIGVLRRHPSWQTGAGVLANNGIIRKKLGVLRRHPSWQTGAGILANNGIIRKKLDR